MHWEETEINKWKCGRIHHRCETQGAVGEQSKTTSVDSGSRGKAPFPTSQCFNVSAETHRLFMTCYICVIVLCSYLSSIKLPGSTFPSWSVHSSIYIHLQRIYDIYIFHIVHDVCIYNTYTHTFTCMHIHMYIYTYIAIFRCICHIYAIYVYTRIYPHIYHLTLWSTHDRICDIGTFPHNSLSTHLSLLCSFPCIPSHLSIAIDMKLYSQ